MAGFKQPSLGSITGIIAGILMVAVGVWALQQFDAGQRIMRGESPF